MMVVSRPPSQQQSKQDDEVMAARQSVILCFSYCPLATASAYSVCLVRCKYKPKSHLYQQNTIIIWKKLDHF